METEIGAEIIRYDRQWRCVTLRPYTTRTTQESIYLAVWHTKCFHCDQPVEAVTSARSAHLSNSFAKINCAKHKGVWRPSAKNSALNSADCTTARATGKWAKIVKEYLSLNAGKCTVADLMFHISETHPRDKRKRDRRYDGLTRTLRTWHNRLWTYDKYLVTLLPAAPIVESIDDLLG